MDGCKSSRADSAQHNNVKMILTAQGMNSYEPTAIARRGEAVGWANVVSWPPR
jgi:hypothetical protein